jgi:hypothetical protein
MVNWRFWSKPKTKGSWAGLRESLKVKPEKRYIYHIADRIYSWPQKCEEYDRYYNDHPEVKAMVLTIAGKATAKGVFLEPRTEYERGKEASELCDRFNEEVGMDQLLYETIPPLVKYGTFLWEKTWMPDPCIQLIPMVKSYKPSSYENYAVGDWEILADDARQSRSPPLIRTKEEIAEFSWNITSTSWPFGTSLLTGLGQTLEITEQLIDDLQEYMHKSAFPNDLIQIGDSDDKPTQTQVSDIASDMKSLEPGERRVTSFTIDHKILGPAPSETNMLDTVLTYLKDRLVDGIMVPPISKQHQRTLASAEVMEDDTDLSLIIPIQRLLKRVLERQIYKPYLMARDFSWKNTPKVSFHPPDENRDEQAAYYIPLVQANIITREAAARELGIEPVDIPSEEDVMRMSVVPPNGFTPGMSKQFGSQQQKAEETINVSVNVKREADEEHDRSHHG